MAAAQQHLRYRLKRMTGRDPQESHRAASPLELLFDLSFVAAIGAAGNQFAHLFADGHIATGIGAFSFALLAICLAWINFSWFASAYDTDDWFYRIATMVQMVGVVILALGLPDLFHSFDEGSHLDIRIVAAGYVVMRIALVAQWVRVAVQDPSRRRTALGYAAIIAIAQLGWVALAVVGPSVAVAFSIAPVLFLVELGGPVIAERTSSGTPWHPHHIAERYGLLTIIALGEGVFGTIASVSALVEEQGWSADATIVVVAGVGLTFGLWWMYFLLPSGHVLAVHRGRAWLWGYGHIVIIAAIAATGAGLHVAAYVIEGVAEIDTVMAVAVVAVPVLAFSSALFGLHTYLLHETDPLHTGLYGATVLVLIAAIALASAGAPIAVCLLVVTVAPVITIVGYEAAGHRHQAAALERVLA